MTKQTRCKFFCESVAQTANGQQVAKLCARYDNTIPEDQRFNEATPWGEMTVGVQNPAVKGFFVPGKCYYLDLTPAD